MKFDISYDRANCIWLATLTTPVDLELIDNPYRIHDLGFTVELWNHPDKMSEGWSDTILCVLPRRRYAAWVPLDQFDTY